MRRDLKTGKKYNNNPCVQGREEKLMLHSKKLISLASGYGMEAVDTFNMTMSRFRDFTEGRCACHFYRIIPKTITGIKQQKLRQEFSLDGPVNAAYSEILLNRICDDGSF
ncbi:unnamed protein product [Notodromas monacha]|uniref:Uncharacterized protein n=1 Tax=Notodromas monacha TaxID=399045 RepID=A0A7R9GIV9_9CRUS|nr:unnamed protein product [Notodromas monacha]CAG0924358.1 unnamed protein product [Notodromas monacha]